jgi:hypothetical protein
MVLCISWRCQPMEELQITEMLVPIMALDIVMPSALMI